MYVKSHDLFWASLNQVESESEELSIKSIISIHQRDAVKTVQYSQSPSYVKRFSLEPAKENPIKQHHSLC